MLLMIKRDCCTSADFVFKGARYVRETVVHAIKTETWDGTFLLFCRTIRLDVFGENKRVH